MSTEEIIIEALAVHLDGQEPQRTADEYEAVLLAIARQEQKPSENVAQAMARVAANGNPEVTALLFAADRVRARDAATTAVKSATLTKAQAEQGMLDLARAEAQPGEGTAAAFARLCESDHRMQKLYDMGQAADVAEAEAVMTKADPGDRFTPMLMEMAKYRRREDETLEAAASRLLHTDPTVMGAYAAVNGL